MLAHLVRWDDGSLVALHNFSSDSVQVPLQLEGCDETHHLVDLLGDESLELDRQGRTTASREGYGYRWLRVVAADSRRLV